MKGGKGVAELRKEIGYEGGGYRGKGEKGAAGLR